MGMSTVEPNQRRRKARGHTYFKSIRLSISFKPEEFLAIQRASGARTVTQTVRDLVAKGLKNDPT